VPRRKPDYSNWEKDKLIARIQELEKRKKYGLVWDEEREPEKVVQQCKNELPVLKEVKSKAIKNDPEKPTHILIEGDNYHALSVLNYTHEKSIDVIYIDPPYNTGAKDWKYNNNYVDENDTYRHSKWLSMMHSRLIIAKNILKRNGVMVVTVDDHELFSLLGLLDRLHAKTLGRVSICIKPEGRRQSNFIMEAHEYAVFVTWGNPKIRGLNIDFGLDFPEKDEISSFRWEGLMRRDASREDRSSNYWFPFYVSNGGLISLDPQDNYKEVWPINTKGIERVWLWDKTRSQENIGELKALIRKGRVTIYYKRRALGRVKPTSFWYGSLYNANAYGTRVLTKILPNSNFDYPKSIYSVLDCIDLFLPKNGSVLDFFAGSGTTAHSTLMLNADDQGKRRFILCTNNENHIADEITYPRIQKCVSGYKDGKQIIKYDGNLKYYKTAFVSAQPTDRNKEKLTKQSVEMLCLRENTFELVSETDIIKIFKSNEKYTGILFDEQKISEFKERIKDFDKPVSVYIFSLGDDDFAEEFEDMQHKVKVCSIPAAILRAYKRIFK
jgi:adenine-specific DNA-methyltransferase